MSYKWTSGSVRRGDIYAQEDTTGDATWIEWGQDTITFRPGNDDTMFLEVDKVGIGTTSPDHTLHVTSPGTCHVKIESEAGYEAALKLSQDGQSSAYVWMPGSTSDLRFYLDGADVMHLDSDGNVGIGTTDPKNALDIHHNPTGLADNTGGGDVVTFGGEDGSDTLAAGKLMYLHSGGDWKYADADAAATSGPVLLGIALGTSVSDGILLRGFFDVATIQGSFSKGAACYVSENAGDIDFTAPSATGDVVRVIGWATDVANVIYFNPSGDWVEIA